MAATMRVGSMALLSAEGRVVQSKHHSIDIAHSATFGSGKSLFLGATISSATTVSQVSRTPVQKQIICAQDLAEQIKEMAAAEKRWESQVKEGKVKSISSKEAGYAVDLSNYTFLDVRPAFERKKAWVKDSVWIPIFEVSKSMDPGTILSKGSSFAMGGWWTGTPLMEYNGRFMPDVVSKIPKSANVIVACQKGLGNLSFRILSDVSSLSCASVIGDGSSLAACEQLYKAGYRNLFWLNGGLDATEEGDLTREGPQPFKFAGLGGVSEFIGWTDVQREAVKKEGLAYRALLFGRLMAVVMGVDLLFLGGQQLAHFIQEMQQ